MYSNSITQILVTFFTFIYFIVPLKAQNEIRFDRLTIDQGLSQNSAHSIVQDKYGFVWIGTTDGLNRYDGQKIVTYHREINNPQTLPNNFISKIFSDREGRLWIGTLKGLSYFDHASETFKSFLKDAENKDIGRIWSIFEDRKGNLWIGTDGNGLKLFDRGQQKFVSYALENKSEIFKKGNIRNINEDKDGNLYIAAFDNGLLIINDLLDSFDLLEHDEANPASLSANTVTSTCFAKDGTIWVGTYGGGLNRLDNRNRSFLHYRHNDNVPNSLGSDFINAVYISSTEELWIATEKGGLNLLSSWKNQSLNLNFLSFKKNVANPLAITVDELYSLYEDISGVLWVGTINGGANFFDLYKRNQYLHYWHDANNIESLSHNSIRRILEDKSGNLWVCTSQEGVNLATPEDRQMGRFQKPRFEYVGVDNIQDYKNAFYKFAIDITQDKKNAIWIATYGGLFEYVTEIDKKTKQPTSFFKSRLLLDNNDSTKPHLPSKQVRSIFCDSKNNLWFGMIKGLSVWDSERKNLKTLYPASDSAQTPSFKITTITAFAEDKDGTIWIGMQGGGVIAYHPQKQTVRTYTNDEQNLRALPTDRITSIYVDKTGSVWIGSSGGLSLYNKKNNDFTNFGKKTGFPNEVIYGILEDEVNHLWLSTNKGIIKFYIPKQEVVAYFDKSDGLQSNEFNLNAFHKSPKGEMFFGGVNGFNAFFPKNITQRAFKPQVVITDFYLGNKAQRNYGEANILKKSMLETKQITLSYEDRAFRFEFVALDFSNSKRIRYSYKMEGFDSDWNSTDASRPYATYTNLAPKTYTFLVKATNGDGVWNEEEITAITLKITPPFWQTWWFGLSLTVLILLSLRYAYQWRVRQLQARQITLEKLVQDRTTDLQNANKHLADNINVMESNKMILEKQTKTLQNANQKLLDLNQFKEGLTNMIVHDLKNPLNTILGLSDRQEVLQAARQMLNMVMNILDVQKFEDTKFYLHISSQRLIKLTYLALDQVRLLYERKSLKINNLIPTHISVQADAEMIERVLINLLTNAIKYTPNNGQITLEINPDFVNAPDESVVIAITDTGKGIPQDKLEAVFEKFSQLEPQKSGMVRSTGLGLSFCKMAVESHKGQIGVSSEEGKGSTFWFTLPLAETTQENKDILLHSLQTDTELSISEAEKQLIVPYLSQLQQLSVYEYSDVKEVLEVMNFADIPRLILWKKDVENAVKACNEEKYRELVFV